MIRVLTNISKTCPLLFTTSVNDEEKKTRAAEFLTYITLSKQLTDALGGGIAGLLRNVADKQTTPVIFHNANGSYGDLLEDRALRRMYTRRCQEPQAGNNTCTICPQIREWFQNLVNTSKSQVPDPGNCENEEIKNEIADHIDAQSIVKALQDHGSDSGYYSLFPGWQHAEKQIPLVDAWLSSVMNGTNELWVFPAPSNKLEQDFKYHGAAWLLVGEHSPVDFLKWQFVLREIFWSTFWRDIAGEYYRKDAERKAQHDLYEALNNRLALIKGRLESAREKENKMVNLRIDRDCSYHEVHELFTHNRIVGHAKFAALAAYLTSELFNNRSPSPPLLAEIGACIGQTRWLPHNFSEWTPEAIQALKGAKGFGLLTDKVKETYEGFQDFKPAFCKRHLAALKSISKFDENGWFSPFILEIYLGIEVPSYPELSDSMEIEVWVLHQQQWTIIDILERFRSFFQEWNIKMKSEATYLFCIGTDGHVVVKCAGIHYQKSEYLAGKHQESVDSGGLRATVKAIKDLGIIDDAQDDALVLRCDHKSIEIITN